MGSHSPGTQRSELKVASYLYHLPEGAETAITSLSSLLLRNRILHIQQFTFCIIFKSCASFTADSTSANSSIESQFT